MLLVAAACLSMAIRWCGRPNWRAGRVGVEDCRRDGFSPRQAQRGGRRDAAPGVIAGCAIVRRMQNSGLDPLFRRRKFVVG